MPNYSTFAAGPWRKLHRHRVEVGHLKVPCKVFLSDKVDSTGSEVSFTRVPAGHSVPFFHRHRLHEEIYIVVQGTGDFLVDGDLLPVTEGSVVRIAPEGIRTFRAGDDGPLDVICIQAVAGTLQSRFIDDGEVVAGDVHWPDEQEGTT